MLLCEMDYEEQKHNERMDAIRKLGLKNLSDIIKAVVSLWLDLYGLASPEEINHGCCEDFAEDVIALYPECEAYWTDELDGTNSGMGQHKIIVCQNRYYDSQCPDGTDNWRELVR